MRVTVSVLVLIAAMVFPTDVFGPDLVSLGLSTCRRHGCGRRHGRRARLQLDRTLIGTAAFPAHASIPMPQHSGTSQCSSPQGIPSSTASTTSTSDPKARVRCGSAIS